MEQSTRTFDENEAQASASAETNNANSVNAPNQNPKKGEKKPIGNIVAGGGGFVAGIGTGILGTVLATSGETTTPDGEIETETAATQIYHSTSVSDASNIVEPTTEPETEPEVLPYVQVDDEEQPYTAISEPEAESVTEDVAMPTYYIGVNPAFEAVIPDNIFPSSDIHTANDEYYAENTHDSSTDFAV